MGATVGALVSTGESCTAVGCAGLAGSEEVGVAIAGSFDSVSGSSIVKGSSLTGSAVGGAAAGGLDRDRLQAVSVRLSMMISIMTAIFFFMSVLLLELLSLRIYSIFIIIQLFCGVD
jgi:hypothetical protein